MRKLYSIGETVYDIIFKNGEPVSARPGGSMLNTSVSLGRMGVSVSFISDLGKDKAGEMVLQFLASNHVSTEFMQMYKGRKTAIALAMLNEKDDAEYSFYKDYPDDRLPDITIDFKPGDIFLFGSFFALTVSLRKVLTDLLIKARNSGCIIIYDPNFRKPHLPELETLRPLIIENIRYSDIVRGSDEDFSLVFGCMTPQEAYQTVSGYGCRNLIYTANRNPACFFSGLNFCTWDVPEIKTVSTIGAGDNFNAGLIWTILRKDIHRTGLFPVPPDAMEVILRNGTLFAGDVCQHYDNYVSEEFAAGMQKDNIV